MKRSLLLPLILAFSPFSPLHTHASELDPVTARYEEMLLRAPEPGPAFERLYEAFAKGQGIEALAKRWQAEADKGGKGSAPYWLLLGHLAERRDQPAEARAAYQKAAEIELGDYKAWSALGKFEANQGRQSAAIEALEKALAVETPESVRSELYRSLALSHQRNLDLESALKTFERALKDFPEDPYLLEEVAEAQAEMGKFDEARKAYEQLRTLVGSDPFKKVTATVKIALLEERQGKGKAAVELYESALPMTTETSWIHREVRNRIEQVYRRQDDLPGLITYYTGWLEKHPKDVEVARRLSKACQELNRQEEAIRWLTQAAEWAPDRHDLQMELARSLRVGEKLDEALKLTTRLTERFPDELSYHELRGEVEWDLFRKSGDPAQRTAALASWSHLAPAETKDAARIARLADLLRRHEAKDEALAAYTRALEAAPASNDLRERLAVYLFELKRTAEADAALAAMVEGDRATASNYRRLAQLQARHEKPAEALQSVEAGLKLAPEDFPLLDLKWQLLVAAKQTADALALYEPLLGAGPAMADQIDSRQVRLIAQQSDTAVKQEAERLAALGESAKEHELRLLVRLRVQLREVEAASKVLEQAQARFPDRPALVKLAVELHRANARPEAAVAELRRLVQLEPKQAGRTLQEIARTWQHAGQMEKAVEAAKEVVALSPADSASHQFLGDIYVMNSQIDEARLAFQEAIRLSEKPNPVRLRLAEIEMNSGHLAAGRELIETAFEAEETPDGKRGVLTQLVQAYQREGRVDQLIERFRERQKGEENGWRYALYLATIYHTLGDAALTREELQKVLASRPTDPALLNQLIQLSEREGNFEEVLRYANLLVEAEPSAKNRIRLAEAHIRRGDAEAAVTLLLENAEAIEADPEPWMPVYIGAAPSPRVAEANAIMQRVLDQKRDGEGGRLRLVEFYLLTRQDARASDLLWEIATEHADGTAYPIPEGSQQNLPMVTYMRVNTGNQAIQEYHRLRTPTQQHFGGSTYSFGSGAPKLPPELRERDRALAYLAALFMEKQEVKAFKERIQALLAPVPLSERLLTYQILGANDLIEAEIEALVSDPKVRGEELVATLTLVSQTRNFFGNSGGSSSSAITKLLNRVLAEPTAAINGMNRILVIHTLKSFQRTAEAEAMMREWLKTEEAGSKEHSLAAAQFAAELGDIESTERFLKLSQANLKNVNAGAYRDHFLLLAYQKAKQPTKAIGILVEMYQKNILSPSPQLTSFGISYNSRAQYHQTFAAPSRYLTTQQVQSVQSFNHQLTQAGVSPKDFLAALAKLQPEGESAALRHQLALAQLYWHTGEKEKAAALIREVVVTRKDGDLALQAALLEEELGKRDAAIELLQRVSARDGALYTFALQRLLSLAKQKEATELIKATLSQLIGQTLQQHEANALLADLREYGFAEKVKDVEKRATQSRPTRSDPYQVADQLRQMRKPEKKDEAISLARSILARTPSLQGNRNADEYNRNVAIETLQHFKGLDAYIAELEKEGEGKPLTVGHGLKLAEAYQRGSKEQRKKGVEIGRQLAELQPDDATFQLRLADQLARQKQDEEALKLYLAVLQKNPTLLFSNNNYQNLQDDKSLFEFARIAAEVTLPPANPQNAHQAVWFYHNLGNRVKEKSNPDLAAKLWKKGLENEGYSGNGQELRQNLIDLLLTEKKDEELKVELLDYFFPPAPQAELNIGRANHYVQEPWLQRFQNRMDGTITFPAVELARHAIRLGLKEELLQREKDSRQTYSHLSLLIRLIENDRTLGKELLKRAGDIQNYMIYTFLRVAAEEMSDWSKPGDLPIQLLERVVSSPHYTQNPWMELSVQRQMMSVAEKLKHDAEKEKAMKRWYTLSSNPQASQSMNVEDYGAMGMEFALRGMLAEAQGCLGMANSKASQQNHRPPVLAELAGVIELLEGKAAPLQASVGLQAGSGTQATLFWSVGMKAKGDGQNSIVPFIGEGKLPPSKHSYDIELLYKAAIDTGKAAPDTVRRIAVIKNAKFTGQWKGKLPATSGSLSARVIGKEGSLDGPWLSYARGKNLLPPFTDPKGWTLPGSLSFKEEKGGLYPGGLSYLVNRSQGNRRDIMSRKIPVEREKTYLLTGWVQSSIHQSPAFWINSFDENGKKLGNQWCNFRGESRSGWSYLSYTVTTEHENRGEAIVLNQGTTHVEIQIQIGDRTSFADFQLIELVDLPPSRDSIAEVP